VLAFAANLVTPTQCIMMVTISTAGIAWLVLPSRRQTPGGAWIECGIATFGLLLLATYLILPGYYRKFSLRDQVWSAPDNMLQTKVRVACYPHLWDSINFYLGRRDVQTYGPGERDRLLADLESVPHTLVFVKSGPPLNDLLRRLPSSLKFFPTSQGEIATSGIVRSRRPTETAQQAGN
jgi:hypothetical protein